MTGYVVIKKLTARSKEQAARALSQALFELSNRCRTITLDNGTEFHDYAAVEAVHKVKFYFCTPYHSWERGTNGAGRPLPSHPPRHGPGRRRERPRPGDLPDLGPCLYPPWDSNPEPAD